MQEKLLALSMVPLELIFVDVFSGLGGNLKTISEIRGRSRLEQSLGMGDPFQLTRALWKESYLWY